VTKPQLEEAFQDFGNILHSEIYENDRGQSKGYGIVLFEKEREAEEAIKVMDKAKFNDREVNVRMDRET